MPKPQNAIRIDAQDLSKRVNGIDILSAVSLSVHPGEFVGLLGPSGAGKSTLLNALNGFRPADEGRVLLNGTNLYKTPERFRTLIGHVPQDDIIHTSLSVQNALYYAALLRFPPDASRQTIQTTVAGVLRALELDGQAKTKIKKLSGGQRKRVNLGIELLTSPPLLFLDEPTSGLDPALEERMMKLFHKLAREGRTVIVSTHIMESLRLLDLVAILHKGWLVFYGPPDLARSSFKVQEFADIYNKLMKMAPEDLAHQYQQSAIYKKYVASRLAGRYRTEHIANDDPEGTATSALQQPANAPNATPSPEDMPPAFRTIEEELEELRKKINNTAEKP